MANDDKYMQDFKPEDHANLVDLAIASLRRKLAALSPPVHAASELLALQNVSSKLRDPDATVVPHGDFVPSTAGVNSTLDTVGLNMATVRAGIPMGIEGTPASDPAAASPPNSESSKGEGGESSTPSKDDKAIGAASAGKDLAINAGATKPPEKV